MAFTTKIILTDDKICQPDAGVLTFCGDNYIASVGTFKYSSDQSGTYSARSIVDKGYVTGLTSGLGGRVTTIENLYLTGATNGIGFTGKRVCLGGALVANTAISGAFTMGFNNTFINLTGSTGVNISAPASGLKLINVPTTGTNTDLILVREASTGIVKGINGGAVLSTAITGATNGVRKTGQNVVLGGNLTGATAIGGATNNLSLGCATSLLGAFTVCSSSVTMNPTAGATINAGGALSLCGNNVAVTTAGAACICPTGALNFDGSVINVCSIACYDQAYTFTNKYSLVDKNYVTGLTTTSGVQTANNGLHIDGTNIHLGGVLTGATTIAGATNNLSLGCATSLLGVFTVCSASVTMNPTAGATINAGGALSLCGNNVAVTTAGAACICPTGALNLDGSVINVCSIACYDQAYTFTNKYSLVDKNYVTGLTTTSGVQTANNGLHIDGTNIHLGGALTGNTTINGAQTLNLCTSNVIINPTASVGICPSSTVTIAPTAGAVNITPTGAVTMNPTTTASIIPTGALIMCGSSITFCGVACYNNLKTFTNIYSLVDKNYVTGITSSICSGYVCSANNGLHKDGTNVHLGGALTGNTSITGSHTMGFNNTTINITGSTINFGGTLYLKSDPAGSGGLLCRDIISGQICETSLAAFGGITGATNGLSDCGLQRVGLGGTLCTPTTINGGGNALCLNGIGAFTECGSSALMCSTTTTGIYSTGVMNLSSAASSGIVLTAPTTGAIYAADYSAGYVARSLVDKGYVDTVATGLNVHTAVTVATTVSGGNINLATGTLLVIDGVQTTAGMRVLVKNQTNQTENGIYIAGTGAWTRATDYDSATEATNGDLIPVTSGSTQNSSIWVLTTPNPVTIGTSNLVFTQFSTIVDVQAGAGIAMSQVGGVHTICVNLGTNSGLNTTSGLVVDGSLAGIGLTLTSGVINVCAQSCGAVGAIPVGYNTAECLVVACSDIITALGTPINSANNGLHKDGTNVHLGGVLTGATTITVASDSCSLTFQDTASTKKGIVYGFTSTAGFANESLVTKRYVTGLTTTSGVQTANNGLHIDGTNIHLGGVLTGATAIAGATNNLSLGCATSLLGAFTVCSASVSINPSGAMTLNAGGNTCINTTGTLAMCGSAVAVTTAGAACICPTGALTLNGSTVNVNTVACYNGLKTFTNIYSLVDKNYVTGLTTTSGIQTANNGLHKDGTNVHLGGVLTGATAIAGATNNLSLGCATSLLGVFTVCSASVSINPSGAMTLNAGGNTCINTTGTLAMCGSAVAVTTAGAACICPTGALNLDGSAINVCSIACYDQAYTFTNIRSLVDKAYVTGLTTTSGIQTANNGLHKDGTNVHLGGVLTGATTIGGAGANLCLGLTGSLLGAYNMCGASSLICTTGAINEYGATVLTCTSSTLDLRATGALGLCSSGPVTLKGTTNIFTGATNCVVASTCVLSCVCTSTTAYSMLGIDIADTNITSCGAGGGSTIIACNTGIPFICGSAGVVVCSPNANGICLTGVVKLPTTPASGAGTDDMLVWNSTDKIVKLVSSSSVGEKNYTYSKATVTAASGLTNTSPYVILVNHTAPITLTLPATPSDGRAFKFKDVSAAGALTNNITIGRNGKNIDGAANDALINTDDGAFEIVYDDILGSWYTLSFVN